MLGRWLSSQRWVGGSRPGMSSDPVIPVFCQWPISHLQHQYLLSRDEVSAFRLGVRLEAFHLVWSRWLSSSSLCGSCLPIPQVGASSPAVQSVWVSWNCSRYKVGALCMVIGWCYFLGVCPDVWLVPSSLVPSMYQAYCIWHFYPTLLGASLRMLLLLSAFTLLAGLVLLIQFFSPYLAVLACGSLSHHSILSFPNQNPSLGSICGEAAELEGKEPIVNTLPHLSWHSKRNRWKWVVLPRGPYEEVEKISYNPAVRIQEISEGPIEIKIWER